METSPRCPTCRQPLPVGTLHGLCPECLLRAGLVTGSQPGPAAGGRFVAPTPAELAPLFPQFEILALVGQGGMGAVYRARQPGLDRVVALKILPPQPGRGAAFAERFTREARALARLSHPNIVAVHEFGAAGEYHFFVMEFVDGVSLRHLLQTGQTKPREALAIVPQICDALQFAHDRGIVHRDIKPENILVDRSGVVKIADFGLAKIVGVEAPDLSLTGEHDVMGTPHYMAPEQVERPLEVDHRADIYSLGVVFYQMLTGELPLGRFAPPSRKVQIDVRLDEIVLRALEQEPERRYQQASGLRAEVETVTGTHAPVAGDVGSAVPGRETRRQRWLVLAAAWVIAGILIGLNGTLVERYLAIADGLGLRGATTVETPLRQIFPGFASDAQMWVRHAIGLTEDHQVRLRTTSLDNAPQGREVHWNSAWAWSIAGAGKLHQLFTGLPFPQAVERATLWLNPVVRFACVIFFSWWAARRVGLIAGVVVALALAGHDRVYEGFFPSYVDHHGLDLIAVLGIVLGAVVMGAGWWRRGTSAGDFLLAGSLAAARQGAVFSALSGAIGMWINATASLPAIVIVGGAGVLVILLRGGAAERGGVVFDPGVWRLWGRLGAGASFAFYLLEYFPNHLGFRLETNHPVHALAWLGLGEFVAQIGERWLGPREQRWRQASQLLWPVLAVAIVATLVAGGGRLFPLLDPFMATLHRDYIQEFQPLTKALGRVEGWGLYRQIGVDALPLVGALAWVVVRRRAAPVAVWFTLFVAAAMAAMAVWHARELLHLAGVSIVLLAVLLTGATATFRPWLRWTVALAVAAGLFLPGVVQRNRGGMQDVAGRRISPADAINALNRDIAAALRATQPQGEITLLASPNASSGIGYYGRFKTLGTLFWENSEGLRAAARIFAAATPAEAGELARAHRVTHVALVSQENFLRQYHELLHPGASEAEVKGSFGLRLFRERVVPAWLKPIAYQVPEDLAPLRVEVQLFRVDFDEPVIKQVSRRD